MNTFLKPVVNDLTRMATETSNSRRFSLANLVTAQIEMKRGLGNLGSGLKRLSVRASTRRRLSNTVSTPFVIPSTKSSTETTSVNSFNRQNSVNLAVQSDPLLCSSAEALFGKQISLNLHNSNLTLTKERSLSKWSLDGLKENQICFINQIGEAVSDSEHLIEFLRKAFRILYFTSFSTFFMSSMAIYHLVVIFTGLKNFENCPSEPKIPIYLFVCGWVGLLKCLHLIWYKFRSSSSISEDDISEVYNYDQNNTQRSRDGLDESSVNKSSYFTDILLNVFIFIWFILGNYWIFSIYLPKFKPLLYEPNNFCEHNVYFFALFQIGLYYSLFVLAVFLAVLLTIFTQIPFLITKFQEF